MSLEAILSILVCMYAAVEHLGDVGEVTLSWDVASTSSSLCMYPPFYLPMTLRVAHRCNLQVVYLVARGFLPGGLMDGAVLSGAT